MGKAKGNCCMYIGTVKKEGGDGEWPHALGYCANGDGVVGENKNNDDLGDRAFKIDGTEYNLKNAQQFSSAEISDSKSFDLCVGATWLVKGAAIMAASAVVATVA